MPLFVTGRAASQAAGRTPLREASAAVARRQRRTVFERRGPTVAARGILDSYRAAQREQQQQQQQQGGLASTTSVSSDEEGEVHVVESLLLEGDVHFTEEDTPCPTDCVIEVYTAEELDSICSSAMPDALIVVDWYKDDCPACKYMAPGFHRMCRSASEHQHRVIFVKHNVYDDDRKLSPLARRFKVKNVPTFTLHKSGEVVEHFATRDKARLAEAVGKHAPATVERWEDEAA